MSSDTAIRVGNLSKCYQIYDKPRHRLLQMLAGGRAQYYREFWALKDISFEVAKGETLGVIGKNGSGKSTLLQLICGTLNQTSGSIEIRGRVAALLELGAGFNPEFTGRENVFLAAALYGLSRQEIAARFNQIADFAEIGEHIEQPVKTYSSGMFVRLAFAVIAHVDADILVVDEALSVGDAYFVQKCMRFLRGFMKRGTLLFCSHDTNAVASLCDSAILLNRGRVEMLGTPKEVTQRYLAALYEANQGESRIGGAAAAPAAAEAAEYRDMREALVNASTLRNDIEIFKFDEAQAGFGTGGARILSARLLDPAGTPLSWAVGGEEVALEIRCLAIQALARPIVGFQFKNRLGQVIFSDNTYIPYQFNMPHIEAGETFVAQFVFRMPVLPSGDYSISPAIAEGTQEDHVQHHWMHDALIVHVHASTVCHGLMGVPMRKISLQTAQESHP
jgi:lipopolysaccharide transport system ATP-binding protein